MNRSKTPPAAPPSGFQRGLEAAAAYLEARSLQVRLEPFTFTTMHSQVPLLLAAEIRAISDEETK